MFVTSKVIDRLRQLVVFAALFFPFAASALSCVDLNDKFLVKCSEHRCEASFRAREIPSFGACARRVVVEPVPVDTQDVILNQMGEAKRDGVYEVTIVHRFYSEPLVNASDLALAFIAHELKAPHLKVKTLASDTNLSVLREQWVARSRWDLLAVSAHWGVELLILCFAISVTYRTISAFHQRLRSASHARLRGLVLVQLGIFLIGFLSLGTPTSLVLVGLMAPAMLLVWLYELVAYLLHRFTRRPTNEV